MINEVHQDPDEASQDAPGILPKERRSQLREITTKPRSHPESKGDKEKGVKLFRRLANTERMKHSYARIRVALQAKRNGSIGSLKVAELNTKGKKEIVEIHAPEESKNVLDRSGSKSQTLQASRQCHSTILRLRFLGPSQ